MEKSDFDLVEDIESLISDHLAAIKKEAYARVLELNAVDRDKAWEQIREAVDGYGGDMRTDATYWLKQQVTEYSSRRWRTASRL